MEVELESFHLIDHTPVCGTHQRNFTGDYAKRHKMKYTLRTVVPAGIYVERPEHEPCLIPIAWVKVFVAKPGKSLRTPKKPAVRRTTKKPVKQD